MRARSSNATWPALQRRAIHRARLPQTAKDPVPRMESRPLRAPGPELRAKDPVRFLQRALTTGGAPRSTVRVHSVAAAPARSAPPLLATRVFLQQLWEKLFWPVPGETLILFLDPSHASPRREREYPPERGCGRALRALAAAANPCGFVLQISVFQLVRCRAEISATVPILPARTLQMHPARSLPRFDGRTVSCATFRTGSLRK